MRGVSVSVVVLALIAQVYSAGSAIKGSGTTTRSWSCCKNSCSWSNKAPVDNPVLTCDAQDQFLDNSARRDGCESGGGSFACSDLTPWAASNDLAYGFAGVNLAASNESAWCCSCYALTFTSGPVSGKRMIVQVTTTGNDLGNDQFDLAIPGGGEGATGGCTKQYGEDVWGAKYGGVAHREDCDALPAQLQAGCYWRFDWFRGADNPTVEWEKVTCPEELSYISNCRRTEEIPSGQPTPSKTTSAPISSGTVQPGGQCGGKSYKGPTRCVGGTVCTFVDENSYYCIADPASTRSTPTTTTTRSATPTIGLPWDQCGGQNWSGATRCQDSTCVKVDDYYWQCQPPSTSKSSQPKTTTTSRTRLPGSDPRTRRTFPGGAQTTTATTTVKGQPTTTTKTAPAPTGPVQLYDQCGGKTYTGSTRCVEGLKCVKVDDFYSQCQK